MNTKPHTPLTLKLHTTLDSAKTRPAYGDGRAVRVYDDCDGPLWLYGHEYGVTLVIRATSWEAAYEIAINESSTIPASEMHEAFGFDTVEEYRAAFGDGSDDACPDLAEGYRFQSNSSGTGIVSVGFYEWLRPMLRADTADIALRISAD